MTEFYAMRSTAINVMHDA